MKKIAESTPQRNPEHISQELDTLVERLKTNVETAAKAGDSFDSLERSVLTSVLQLGQQALELLLSLQGYGDLGEDIETADSKPTSEAAAASTWAMLRCSDDCSFASMTKKASRLLARIRRRKHSAVGKQDISQR